MRDAVACGLTLSADSKKLRFFLFASHPAALLLLIGCLHQFSRLFGISGNRALLIAEPLGPSKRSLTTAAYNSISNPAGAEGQ